MPEPTDKEFEKILIDAWRHKMLTDHKETLPPITRRMVEADQYSVGRVLNQLHSEVHQRPEYASRLHPRLRKLLAGHLRMIKVQCQQTLLELNTSPKTKPVRQKSPPDVAIELDREPFFQFGRALQRGLGKGKLGHVTLVAKDGVLEIESGWGGSRIPCTKGRAISATVSATAFCSLITTRYREKQPAGSMTIVFRPKLKEVGIDLIGVKAQFDS